jgi:hypothetical protein
MNDHREGGFLRRLLVKTLCILCGDEDELLVAELRELPSMPRCCPRCRGSMVAAEWKVMWLPDPNVRFDWDADAPRRGRPPKRHTEAITPSRALKNVHFGWLRLFRSR